MVLPHSMRLRGYKCFNYLYKEGKRYHGYSLVMRVVRAKPNLMKANPKLKESELNSIKCAVSISHKVSKKAVTRNKIRRNIHNFLRKKLSSKTFQSDYWILFSLKPISSTKNSSDLLKECENLLLKASLLK